MLLITTVAAFRVIFRNGANIFHIVSVTTHLDATIFIVVPLFTVVVETLMMVTLAASVFNSDLTKIGVFVSIAVEVNARFVGLDPLGTVSVGAELVGAGTRAGGRVFFDGADVVFRLFTSEFDTSLLRIVPLFAS